MFGHNRLIISLFRLTQNLNSSWELRYKKKKYRTTIHYFWVPLRPQQLSISLILWLPAFHHGLVLPLFRHYVQQTCCPCESWPSVSTISSLDDSIICGSNDGVDIDNSIVLFLSYLLITIFALSLLFLLGTASDHRSRTTPTIIPFQYDFRPGPCINTEAQSSLYPMIFFYSSTLFSQEGIQSFENRKCKTLKAQEMKN